MSFGAGNFVSPWANGPQQSVGNLDPISLAQTLVNVALTMQGQNMNQTSSGNLKDHNSMPGEIFQDVGTGFGSSNQNMDKFRGDIDRFGGNYNKMKENNAEHMGYYDRENDLEFQRNEKENSAGVYREDRKKMMGSYRHNRDGSMGSQRDDIRRQTHRDRSPIDKEQFGGGGDALNRDCFDKGNYFNIEGNQKAPVNVWAGQNTGIGKGDNIWKEDDTKNKGILGTNPNEGRGLLGKGPDDPHKHRVSDFHIEGNQKAPGNVWAGHDTGIRKSANIWKEDETSDKGILANNLNEGRVLMGKGLDDLHQHRRIDVNIGGNQKAPSNVWAGQDTTIGKGGNIWREDDTNLKGVLGTNLNEGRGLLGNAPDDLHQVNSSSRWSWNDDNSTNAGGRSLKVDTIFNKGRDLPGKAPDNLNQHPFFESKKSSDLMNCQSDTPGSGSSWFASGFNNSSMTQNKNFGETSNQLNIRPWQNFNNRSVLKPVLPPQPVPPPNGSELKENLGEIKQSLGKPFYAKSGNPTTTNITCQPSANNNDNSITKSSAADFTEIPNKMFHCHTCDEKMGNSELFKNHIHSQNHYKAMEHLSENLATKTALIRKNIASMEGKRETGMRKGKKGNESRTFCHICAIQISGSILMHRKQNYHQKLEQFIHPHCAPCDQAFQHRIDWEFHRLSSGHLWKLVENGKDTSYQEMDHVEFNMFVEAIERKNELAEKEELEKAQKEKHKTHLDYDKYDPDQEVGDNFVKPVNGFFCRLCKKFFASGPESVSIHCKSKDHWQKYSIMMKKAHGIGDQQIKMETERDPENVPELGRDVDKSLDSDMEDVSKDSNLPKAGK